MINIPERFPTKTPAMKIIRPDIIFFPSMVVIVTEYQFLSAYFAL